MKIISLKDISSKEIIEIVKYNMEHGLGEGLVTRMIGEEMFIVDYREEN